jgi:hypothetical protein
VVSWSSPLWTPHHHPLSSINKSCQFSTLYYFIIIFIIITAISTFQIMALLYSNHVPKDADQLETVNFNPSNRTNWRRAALTLIRTVLDVLPKLLILSGRIPRKLSTFLIWILCWWLKLSFPRFSQTLPNQMSLVLFMFTNFDYKNVPFILRGNLGVDLFKATLYSIQSSACARRHKQIYVTLSPFSSRL